MYRLLKDKNNEFQCEIRLEGASAKNAKVRLFLEADGCDYSFNGTIEGERCLVPMGKLKKFENLLESGKIRLEVIADDTWFVPYESDYVLEQEKKVTVEVKQPDYEPKKALVEVKVEEPAPTKKPEIKQPVKPDPVKQIKTYLQENAKFDGTIKSFRSAIKNKTHKIFFNNMCESSKLDKLTVLKQILK